MTWRRAIHAAIRDGDRAERSLSASARDKLLSMPRRVRLEALAAGAGAELLEKDRHAVIAGRRRKKRQARSPQANTDPREATGFQNLPILMMLMIVIYAAPVLATDAVLGDFWLRELIERHTLTALIRNEIPVAAALTAMVIAAKDVPNLALAFFHSAFVHSQNTKTAAWIAFLLITAQTVWTEALL